MEKEKMSETLRGKKMARQKKNALWWLSIDRYGRQPIAFPVSTPHFMQTYSQRSDIRSNQLTAMWQKH